MRLTIREAARHGVWLSLGLSSLDRLVRLRWRMQRESFLCTKRYSDLRIANDYCGSSSGVIWSCLEIGIQKLVTCRFGASALRLDSDKNGVDFCQNVWVIVLEHPAVQLLIIYIEDAQALRRRLSRPTRSPNLKRRIPLQSVLITEIKCIK